MPSARILVPLLGGFLVMALSVFAGGWVFERQQKASGWVRHTLEAQTLIVDVSLRMTDAETNLRGYLLVPDADFLVSYKEALGPIWEEVDGLARATSDNPVQREAIEELRAAITEKMDVLQQTVALAEKGPTKDLEGLLHSGRGRQAMLTLRSVLSRMEREERRLLSQRTASLERSVTIGRSVWLWSAVTVIGMSVFAIWEARRRILLLRESNRRLADESIARQDAQKQVHQLQKMEAVGQLTGGIAHDFNNMLAIVIGSLDLALRRLNASEPLQVAQMIRAATDAARRATALTARLLAFSRRQPLEPKVVDANKLVAQTSEILRRTLGETIQLETVLAGGLWLAFADPTQIESTLVNLSLNARDAMSGTGRLTLETANTELDDQYARAHDEVVAGQCVMISVTDTGTGMSAEVLERAFEPFYTTKSVGKGSGLGLSQVFGFIKQSRGHVKIYSEVGHGTSVKIYFPRYVGRAPEFKNRPGSIISAPIATGKESILVVEDEEQVRATSVAALRELGYNTFEAANGNDALSLIEKQPAIDLLFTDIVMPDMSGRQLADAILAICPSIKVLYTTGYTRNAIVHNGIVDIGVAFLSKPFSIDALASKVREVLDAERCS
jgi:signal transduction histidine kinase/ActR/RegA family two-component response regulator